MAMVRMRLLLLCCFVGVSVATFMVEENALTVSTPESLKGTYQSAIGNFGVPQYGGTLSGFVMLPTVNLKGCDRFPDNHFRPNVGARPNFALIERGGKILPLHCVR